MTEPLTPKELDQIKCEVYALTYPTEVDRRTRLDRLLDIARDHARLVKEQNSYHDCPGCSFCSTAPLPIDTLRAQLAQAREDLRVQVSLDLRHLARIKAICDGTGEPQDSGDSPEMLSARAVRAQLEEANREVERLTQSKDAIGLHCALLDQQNYSLRQSLEAANARIEKLESADRGYANLHARLKLLERVREAAHWHWVDDPRGEWLGAALDAALADPTDTGEPPEPTTIGELLTDSDKAALRKNLEALDASRRVRYDKP